MAETAADAALLRIDDARFAYRNRPALRGATLDVRRGEIVVLLGPNGAGKSTLAKAISGRLKLDGGSVRIAGRDPAGDRVARRIAGFVPQQIAVYEWLTARENLFAFGRLMGVPNRNIPTTADQVLQLVGLQERSNDRAQALSGGMRRLLNIGAALMHKPRLLVLDEPTVGVDFRARAGVCALLRTLRDRGFALLLTTHDMEEAEALADRVAIIVAGEVRDQGEPDDLIERIFGNRKHLTIAFKPDGDAALEEAERAALQAAGLRETVPGTRWSGLVEGDDELLSALVETVLAADPSTREIRVRAPGLDSLLARYVDQESG